MIKMTELVLYTPTCIYIDDGSAQPHALRYSFPKSKQVILC